MLEFLEAKASWRWPTPSPQQPPVGLPTQADLSLHTVDTEKYNTYFRIV